MEGKDDKKRKASRSPSPVLPEEKRVTEENISEPMEEEVSDTELLALLGTGTIGTIEKYFSQHPLISLGIDHSHIEAISQNEQLTAENKKSLLETLINQPDKTGFSFLHNLILTLERGKLPPSQLVEMLGKYKEYITIDNRNSITDYISESQEIELVVGILALANMSIIQVYFEKHPFTSIEMGLSYLKAVSQNEQLTAENKKLLLETLINQPDKTGFSFLHNLISGVEYNQVSLDELKKIVNEYKDFITIDSCYNIIDYTLKKERKEAIPVILALQNTSFQDAISKKLTTQNQYGNTLLHLACMITTLEDTETLKLLITSESINLCNAAGNTPLHITIQSNMLLLINELILEKADCHIKNKDGRTPLAEVIQYKNSESLSYILSTSIFDKENLDDIHQLFIAIFKENLLDIEVLLTYIDLNTTDYNGFHALHYALMFNNIKAINFLLAHQDFKSLDTPDPMGRNLFCFVRSKETLILLLKAKQKEGKINFSELVKTDKFDLRAIDWLYVIDVHSNSQTPILSEKTIQMLKGKYNTKPVHLPVMLNKIKEIIRTNPETYCLSFEKGETPTNIVCSSIFFTNPKHKGYYQKQLIIKIDDLSSNKFMLNFLNAQCNIIKHQYNLKALFRISNDELVQWYSELSKLTDKPSLLTYILNHNEYIKFTNDSAQTLLHLAVSDSNLLLVETLLEAGIKINAVDKDKKTCLDCCKNEDIKNILIKNGAKNGEVIKNILQSDTNLESHLTIFTPWGDNLSEFPTNATEEAGGSYDRGFTVLIPMEAVNLKSDMIHEWAHRFVSLSDIDLQKAVEKYFSIFKNSPGLKTSNVAEEDCAKILQGSLAYSDVKQMEEFFVRLFEILAKHGDLAMNFLKVNFGEEIENQLNNIIIKDKSFLIESEESSKRYNSSIQVMVEPNTLTIFPKQPENPNDTKNTPTDDKNNAPPH